MNEIVGFEHLHLHTTEGSLLDGYGKVAEYASRAPKVNQKFLCISDHGMLSAVPEQLRQCEANNLQPIFAVELYLNPEQPEVKRGESMTQIVKQLSDEERNRMRKSYHLLAIAQNEKGYENLVKLTSWGHLHGFYYRPRVNYDMLNKHKDGIIFCSGCYNCEIGQTFELLGEDAAFDVVQRYNDMFAPNFYLELMMLDFSRQKPYDVFLLKAHDKFGIPLVLTNDCHYCMKEDSFYQRLMLMIQTSRTIAEIEKAKTESADLFELQDENLWMKSEEELNEFWSQKYSDVFDYDLFKQAKLNTVEICNKSKGVELDRTLKLPRLENEDEELLIKVREGFQKRGLPQSKVYISRLIEEYELIKEKEFSSYFLIQAMMTDEARRVAPKLLGFGDGSEAVGPARGSAGGSLICYCLGITDVDPIPHGLLFSRFLSPSRGGKTLKYKFGSEPINVQNEEDECPFDVD